MSSPEFVRLDGQVVRVTSLRTDDDSGDITLVVVARGTVAKSQLAGIAARPQLRFEIPDEAPEETRYVRAVDIRSTGEFEQTMTRLRLDLTATPTSTGPDAAPHETQLDRIERKLDELLALMKQR